MWLLTFTRFSARWLHAPRGRPIALNEWENGVLYTWQPLMWGCYHVIKRVCSTHGSRWCGAVIMWIRVSATHGSRWCGAVIMWLRECPLNTAAADVGLVSCEWEGVLYTWQPLMWDCYHVIERVSSTHSSRWWGAGIVWMSEELSDCALHTAERHSEAGAACLDSGFFRAASAATWDPFAPTSAFGSPHRHGRGTWEAGLMSCPAGSTGERNADIQSAWAHHLSPEGLPLIRGQIFIFISNLSLRKCHTHLKAAEERPYACPRMSEA